MRPAFGQSTASYQALLQMVVEQESPPSIGIPQKSTTTHIRQQPQEHLAIQVFLPVTRSTIATRANWRLPNPSLQVQANNRSANQTDHRKNEPLQGHRPKRTFECSTNSLRGSANSPSRMLIPCNVPPQHFPTTMENHIHSCTTC